MSEPSTYSFTRYLEAKQTVDDRALNHRVKNCFREWLSEQKSPLRVIELGAGTGAMLRRCITWDGLPSRVRYTAIDEDQSLLSTAETRTKDHARNHGYSITANDSLNLQKNRQTITVEFIAGDALEYVAGTDHDWSAVVAHAFLDLVDAPSAITSIRREITSPGCVYFPITFDGVTIFRPTIDPALDHRVTTQYHQYMDDTGGTSTAGRKVIESLQPHATAIEIGGSDWVVTPEPQGYPDDEQYFLHHIIHSVKTALTQADTISAPDLEHWSEQRHRQIERGALVYLTHQLDIYAEL